MSNFKIGDKVISNYSTTNGLIGTIVNIHSDSSYRWEVQFEGWTGGHSGDSCILGTRDRFYIEEKYLKLVKTLNNPIIINSTGGKMPTTANKKIVCDINFTRVNGEQLLFIKTTKEIANLFKSTTTAVSENYLDKDGKKLRYQKDISNLAQYVTKFRQQSYSMNVKLDRYGTNLMVEGAYNFSILRTKGIEDGVTVKVGDLILEDDVSNWGQALGAFLKFLHRNYIDKVEVKITIVAEI